MRSLWILLLLVLCCEGLIAQLSRADSNFLSRFALDGITALKDRTGKYLSTRNIFYLVKSNNRFDASNSDQFELVRLLSDHHAILKSSLSIDDLIKSLQFEFVAPANDSWKLPPGYSADIFSRDEKKWIVVFSSATESESLLKEINGKINEQDRSTRTIVIELGRPADALALYHSKSIIFIQPFPRQPKEELSINGFDLGTNRINVVHNSYATINGSGLNVAVKENNLDTTDIDFKGRYISTGLSSTIVTSHASIMATMIAGGGNTYHLGKGAAWNAKLASFNFTQLLPEPGGVYDQYRISVENHSYGTAIENFYGADAAAYDASVINNPFLVHVFSSGNSGTSTSSSGSYSGIANFANLTGSFKMAKNIITVGATDSFANIETLSSRGPAYDGRIKPELVAFGQDGSSGAAALVSGTALLIQQSFKSQHQDSLPPAALVKATLVNSADDIGSPGPDFISGFGSLNAARAVRSVINQQYFLSSIANNNTQTFLLNLTAGIAQLKVTLAYTDVPAQANAFKALVNDLDLELIEQASGQVWKPWVLNSTANKDSLSLTATRKKDSLNNIEQVSIDHPNAGLYQVKISGFKVSNTSQPYAIAYQADTLDQFAWDFPKRNDAVFAHASQITRWQETFGGIGRLEFSINNGNTWQLVSSNVELDKKFYQWNSPDTFSKALLKMTINGKSFVSDTIVISRPAQMKVGFNCPDSVLLNWNRQTGTDNYRVYALTSDYLQPIIDRTDTFFLFSKASINSRHFTVVPLLQGREGIKAFTINYETQGVACYFKSFLAQLNQDVASLFLELGAIYGIKQIEVQKDNGNDFTTVQTVTNPTELIFQFDVGNLHAGVNRFRIKLVLQNGTLLYSQQEIVYYLPNSEFIIYPNPTAVGSGFTILRKDVEEASFLMYDLYGRRIMQASLPDIINPVNTSSLQRGVYIVVILDKNGQKKFKQKVILD